MLTVNEIVSEHACTLEQSRTGGSGSSHLRGSLWLFELPLHHACLMINCNMFKSSGKIFATKTRQHACKQCIEGEKPSNKCCVLHSVYLWK